MASTIFRRSEPDKLTAHYFFHFLIGLIMSTSFRTFVSAFLFSATVLVSHLPAQEDTKGTAQAFQMNLESDLTMTVQGQKQKIDADTTFAYTHWSKPNQKLIGLDSMGIKVMIDGNTQMDTLMSKDQFATVENGEKNVIPVDEANEKLKAILQSSFGKPVFKLELDDDGAIVKQTIDPEAAKLAVVGADMAANTLLFHPVYVDQAEFESKSSVGMGGGKVIGGTLTYKRGEPKDNLVPFTVTGKFVAESMVLQGLNVANVSYDITGTQTYDSKAGHWSAGKFNMVVGYDMMARGNKIGNAAGNMVATMEAIKAKE